MGKIQKVQKRWQQPRPFDRPLTDEERKELAIIFDVQVEELYKLISGFGKKLAGDGKYVESYAKREATGMSAKDNHAEHDAKWSTKEYHYVDKNGKKQVKKEYHYGFKAHIICDVDTELPVAYSVTAANVDEKKKWSMAIGKIKNGKEKKEKIRSLTNAAWLSVYDNKKMRPSSVC